jgi:hypothetical protein
LLLHCPSCDIRSCDPSYAFCRRPVSRLHRRPLHCLGP